MWLLLACRASSVPPAPPVDPSADVRAATLAWQERVREMDSDGLAATFLPDGRLEQADGKASVGPTDIAAFLHGFDDYRLESYDATIDAIDGTTVTGHYVEHVTLPSGEAVVAEGEYRVEWRRAADGAWRIARASTTPDR